MATDPRAPRIDIGGSSASAAVLGRLIDLRIDRRLNLTGSASMRFSGATDGLGLPLGTKVDVIAPGGQKAFSGVVTAVEVERYDAQHRVTTIGLLDHSCKLRHTSRTMTRLKVRASDVATSMAQAAGLQPSVTSTTTRYEYLLQNGNDLDYLDGLLAREGCDWWCDGLKFVAKPLTVAGGQAKVVKAVELERLSVRASSIRPDKVVVRGWGVDHTAVTGQEALQAGHLGGSGAMADMVKKANGALGSPQEHSTASLPVIDAQEAARLAGAALTRAASAALRAELEGPGLWDIGPGDVVEVKDGGDATGKYLVTEVQHRFADGLASSRIISGDRRPTTIGGPAADEPTAPVLHGIVVGVVTDLNDPKKKGRVRARVPGLDGQQESDWARVSSIAAGNGRGSSIRPEVGDEVLMAFEGGDLRKPVILGSLFTAKTDLPDLTLGQGKFERATVLHQFGHSIVLWGDQSTEGIEIKLKGGATLKVDNTGFLLKGGGKQTTTKIEQGQSSIEMKKDGTITIKGVKIVVDAETDVQINGMNITAKSDLATKVEGGVSLELKGGTSAKVDGGLMTEVKGAVVKIN